MCCLVWDFATVVGQASLEAVSKCWHFLSILPSMAQLFGVVKDWWKEYKCTNLLILDNTLTRWSARLCLGLFWHTSWFYTRVLILIFPFLAYPAWQNCLRMVRDTLKAYKGTHRDSRVRILSWWFNRFYLRLFGHSAWFHNNMAKQYLRLREVIFDWAWLRGIRILVN